MLPVQTASELRGRGECVDAKTGAEFICPEPLFCFGPRRARLDLAALPEIPEAYIQHSRSLTATASRILASVGPQRTWPPSTSVCKEKQLQRLQPPSAPPKTGRLQAALAQQRLGRLPQSAGQRTCSSMIFSSKLHDTQSFGSRLEYMRALKVRLLKETRSTLRQVAPSCLDYEPHGAWKYHFDWSGLLLQLCLWMPFRSHQCLVEREAQQWAVGKARRDPEPGSGIGQARPR